MRRLALALAAAAGLILAGDAAGAARNGVSHARLAQAAREAPLKLIDYDEDRCDGRTVEDWLTALTAGQAKSIAWSGGACRLVGPGIDAGSSWCGQAVITLKSPLSRRDRPMVEIFFETPKGDAPGVPYAFRGDVQAPDGQGEMIRFRRDFEAAWLERFPDSRSAIVDCPA